MCLKQSLIPSCCLVFFLSLSLFISPDLSPLLSSHNTTTAFIFIPVTISSQSRQFSRYRPFQNGLLSAPPASSSSFSAETDIIDPQRTTFSTPPSIITTTSESPTQEPLNFSLASRSSSSFPNSFTTFDFQSFTTDNHQQLWPPTPPPQQPLAQNPDPNNNNSIVSNSSNSPQEDFVLYPQPQPRDLRASAQLSTAPRQYAAYQRSQVHPGQPLRRHSVNLQQQFASSPVQVPRANRLVPQSAGYPLSTTFRSSPSNQKNLLRWFAASNSAPAAPNSTTTVNNRPPIPLFNNSTTNSPTQNQYIQLVNHRRNLSTPNMAQDLFSLPSDQLSDELAHLTDAGMFSPQLIPTGFIASKDGEVPEATVSPKDLMMDSSAPPSASFTDLSTPMFESPAWSEDTSPLFDTGLDLAAGHENWGSLFPEELPIPFDPAALEIAASLSQEVKPEPSASPAVQSISSPVRSPVVRGSATKHSAVAGVNARHRKPLAPIKYDESDPAAVKRARNTEAARKSRAKKLERQGDMERRIQDLQQELAEAKRSAEYWKTMAQSRGC